MNAYVDSNNDGCDVVFLKEVEQIWVTLDGDMGYKCVYDKSTNIMDK